MNTYHHHHHHLFAQNTITVDNGYVNEQDRKAQCALTSAHNITERNTHSTINTWHRCDKKSIEIIWNDHVTYMYIMECQRYENYSTE